MGLFNVVSSIVGLGADFGLTSLIGNVAATVTTKSGSKIADKICIGIGTAVLAGMAGEAAQNYIQRKADSIQLSLTQAGMVRELETEEKEDEGEKEEVNE